MRSINPAPRGDIESSRCAGGAVHPGKLHWLTQGNGILISLVLPRSRFADKKKERDSLPALARRRLDEDSRWPSRRFSTWQPRASLGCNFGNLISRLNRGVRDRGRTRQLERKETQSTRRGELQLGRRVRKARKRHVR